MISKETQIAAERAAESTYHRMYDMGATMEDCINASADAYEDIAEEKMTDPLGFFGIDEEYYEEMKYN